MARLRLLPRFTDRLPNPLLLRSIVIGTILGTLTSTLQIVQARIGQVVETQAVQQHNKTRDDDHPVVENYSNAFPTSSRTGADQVDVDRPVIPGERVQADVSIDEEKEKEDTSPLNRDLNMGKDGSASWWSYLGLSGLTRKVEDIRKV